MEAKDTIKPCGDEHCQPYCHEAQAEVSFKVGEDKGTHKVVEWIMKHDKSVNYPLQGSWLIISPEDKAKLKEWGIKKGGR